VETPSSSAGPIHPQFRPGGSRSHGSLRDAEYGCILEPSDFAEFHAGPLSTSMQTENDTERLLVHCLIRDWKPKHSQTGDELSRTTNYSFTFTAEDGTAAPSYTVSIKVELSADVEWNVVAHIQDGMVPALSSMDPTRLLPLQLSYLNAGRRRDLSLADHDPSAPTPAASYPLLTIPTPSFCF
jgi:hypothetical protein